MRVTGNMGQMWSSGRRAAGRQSIYVAREDYANSRQGIVILVLAAPLALCCCPPVRRSAMIHARRHFFAADSASSVAYRQQFSL